MIEGFLPRQLSPEEVETAITTALTEANATGLRDIGKVMTLLKATYTGQMDFATVGPMVKARLG